MHTAHDIGGNRLRTSTLAIVSALLLLLGACASQPSGDGYSADERDFGLSTAYTVTFSYFDKDRTLRLVDTMSRQFPGHQGTELLESNSVLSRYEYVSRAKAAALDRWFTEALLADGLSANAFTILVSGADIRIERL